MFLLFFFFSVWFWLLLLFFLSVEFLLSILSSQLIETFSDLADGFLCNDDVKIFVFIFLGAEIGSNFFDRIWFLFLSIFKFVLALYFNCFFVITGFRGRFTWIFFINGVDDLLLCVIFSKNFFSVSYNFKIKYINIWQLLNIFELYILIVLDSLDVSFFLIYFIY